MATTAEQPAAQGIRRKARALIQAIQAGDEAAVESAVLALSRSRRIFAPLVFAVGAFVMLFQGLRLLFSNWRLTLIQVLPAMWIWVAMLDLKGHVFHGREFHSWHGGVEVALVIAIAVVTAAGFYLNAVFAFAISTPTSGGPHMSVFASAASRTLAKTLPPWWLLLITGISWTLVGLIVLRFDYTSVSAIAILFGIVAISAGVLEIGVTMMAAGWWKLLYGLLAFISIAVGIVAFIHPGDTFVALAAVISFFLIFAGTWDIIISISTRSEINVWWLQLVGGIIELFLGFWAAGYYGRSAVLLIAWVAAYTLIRGVRDIVLAFRVREVQHAVASAS